MQTQTTHFELSKYKKVNPACLLCGNAKFAKENVSNYTIILGFTNKEEHLMP